MSAGWVLERRIIPNTQSRRPPHGSSPVLVPSASRFMSNFSASIARGAACALFLLLIQARAWATDYYLGSGANTQPGIALRDLDDPNARVLAPGDRVWLQAGELFNGNLYLGPEDAGTPANPITISSFGTGIATIQAGDGSAITIYNSSGFQITRLNLVG